MSDVWDEPRTWTVHELIIEPKEGSMRKKQRVTIKLRPELCTFIASENFQNDSWTYVIEGELEVETESLDKFAIVVHFDGHPVTGRVNDKRYNYRIPSDLIVMKDDLVVCSTQFGEARGVVKDVVDKAPGGIVPYREVLEVLVPAAEVPPMPRPEEKNIFDFDFYG